jgi:hypothetical protein
MLAFDGQATFVDFIKAIGLINIDGNVYTYNGANLHIDRTLGNCYYLGANWIYDPSSPNIIISAAEYELTFGYTWRTGTGWSISYSDTIDPENYDNGAGLIAVPTGKWQIQVLWYFPNINLTGIQYGQAVYDTSVIAAANLSTPIETNPTAGVNALFRGWLLVKQGTTALNNSSNAIFYTAGKWGMVGGGSGGGGGGTLDHSALTHLDYSSSGHTGFVSIETHNKDLNPSRFPMMMAQDGEDGFSMPGAPGSPGSAGAAGATGIMGPPGQDGDDGQDAWPLRNINPAGTVVSETTASQSPAVGVSQDYARADHTHGTPAPGAGAAVSANQMSPASNVTISAGQAADVSQFFEIVATYTLEIAATAYFEIG